MKRIILLSGLLLSCALPTRVLSADTPANGRTARVAGGAQVTLVASARTAAQWTAARPRCKDLRPKVRGTFD